VPTDTLRYFPAPPRQHGRRLWRYAAFVSAATPAVFLLGVPIASALIAALTGRAGLVASVLLGGQVLTVVAGLALGAVGLVDGIRRRAWGITALAGFGVAVNVLLAHTVGRAFYYVGRAQSQREINVPQWEPVTERTMPLAVRMPQNAKRETGVAVRPPGVKSHVQWNARQGPAVFIADCAEIENSPSRTLPAPAVFLERYLDRSVSAVREPKVAYRKDVEHLGQIGREVQMEYDAPDGVRLIQFKRCFMVRNFLYGLSVVVPKADYSADPESVDGATRELFQSLDFSVRKP